MHVQLLVVTRKEGTSKTTGRTYQFLELQGVLHQDDGKQDVFVYDFWGQRDQPLPDLKPGRYDVVTELKPDNKTRKLEAQIRELRPSVAANSPMPQTGKVAA